MQFLPQRGLASFGRRAGHLALALLVAAWPGQFARAQERNAIQVSFARDTSQSINVDLLVGQSRILEFDQPYDVLSASIPDVVEITTVTSTQVVVSGKAHGQINLIVWSKPTSPKEQRRLVVFSIYVQNNLTLIDNQIKILFPKENIQLSQAKDGIVLSGSVTNPDFAADVEKVVKAAGFAQVVNLLKKPTTDALQVQMQIRVAEVNRQVLREFAAAYGILNSSVPTYINPGGPASLSDYSASNTGGVVNQTLKVTPGSALNLLLGGANSSALTSVYIRALQQRGALRSLAEPTLIAMNGKTASFIAGGEFPIPLITSATNGQSGISISFKSYGVKLDFTPTIKDENHIQLELEPEVSSVDYGAGITLNSLVIPGLRLRRAKTTLELRDGQSFALAGLIDNNEQVNLSKIPLLGDVPVLGELFKSRRFQRNETELMFLVTVKLVEPMNPDQLPRLPGVTEAQPSTSPLPTGNPGAPKASSLTSPANWIEGQSGHALPPGKAAQSSPAKVLPEKAAPVPKAAQVSPPQ